MKDSSPKINAVKIVVNTPQRLPVTVTPQNQP